MSDIAMASAAAREGGREAIVRLLESNGIDVNHVEPGPIEVEPVGDAFAIHFRSVLFVTPEQFATAMHQSKDPEEV